MKKIIVSSVVLFLLLPLLSFTQTAKSAAGQPKVLVYYFHMINRCKTCNAIEAATRKTVETYYKKQVDDGTLVLKVFNAEEKANEKLAEKYQAYGATLAVTGIKNGKESIEDMTNMAFSRVNDEKKFQSELRKAIDKQLK